MHRGFSRSSEAYLSQVNPAFGRFYLCFYEIIMIHSSPGTFLNLRNGSHKGRSVDTDRSPRAHGHKSNCFFTRRRRRAFRPPPERHIKGIPLRSRRLPGSCSRARSVSLEMSDIAVVTSRLYTGGTRSRRPRSSPGVTGSLPPSS
ncbi:hypothetical protein SKAU_G00018420 [Synaphobranchus kaupii]|uniref:Uncharacterized protein n=1 Tax=Synaphobranchus kaupii TaxID=118154 RepID=A0A9Q1GBF5_SYNKA|nr:hypothetical protein SKAU_G00018420 [Synaphobranchus kaupii]